MVINLFYFIESFLLQNYAGFSATPPARAGLVPGAIHPQAKAWGLLALSIRNSTLRIPESWPEYKNLVFGADGHASIIVAILPPSDHKRQ